MKLVSLISLVLLFGTEYVVASEQLNLTQLIGKWYRGQEGECFSTRVVYQQDGIKRVEFMHCDETGPAQAFKYESYWSVVGDQIKEVTYRADPGLLAKYDVMLPHIEVDTIERLNARELVIIDAKNPYEHIVYKRVD